MRAREFALEPPLEQGLRSPFLAAELRRNEGREAHHQLGVDKQGGEAAWLRVLDNPSRHARSVMPTGPLRSPEAIPE
jgi:hypothetical protein